MNSNALKVVLEGLKSIVFKIKVTAECFKFLFFLSFLISLTDACCLDFKCFICIYRDCVCIVLLHVHSLVSYKVPATYCSARLC